MAVKDGSDRVVSVPIGGKSLDSSGVGNMLFNQFEEARKNKADAAQLDVTEGIRSKYRQQEAAQGNVFAEGLTKLRDFLNTQATDVAYQRQQEAHKQAASALGGMITGAANQGVSLPTLTQTEGQVPEAGYPGTVSAKPIAPGAVDVTKDMFMKEMEDSFKQRELRTGMKMDAEKKVLYDQLDKQDEGTAAEARDWHNRFTALGADPRLLATIAGYTQAGKGSKMEWHEVKTKLVPEEMKLASVADYKMKLAREITARTLDNTALKTRAAQALANNKMDATQYKNLATLHHEIGQKVAQTTKRASELLEAVYAESDTNRQQQLQTQAAQLRAQAQDLQDQQTQIAQKMTTWQPLNPGSPNPGQAGPTLPGGFQELPKPSGDPLGIKPRGK
jgi:hypothetical protein